MLLSMLSKGGAFIGGAWGVPIDSVDIQLVELALLAILMEQVG